MKNLSSAEDFKDFIDKFDTFLFDCDGVLWQGNSLIEHVDVVLRGLRAIGKRIIFVTNNSSKSRKNYLEKFQKIGIAADIEEIFGSAYCAAFYMRNNLEFPHDKKVYVIGMSGILEELDSVGIKHCGAHRDNQNIGDMAHIGDVELESDVGAVLLGFDLDINYKKLAKAFTYLRNPECAFLATNSDLTYPSGGTVFPGTGAILAALKAPLNREPTILGKPHQSMLNCIVDKCHLDRTKTVMVGDRLDTDIAFGKLGNISTLLVLTGVTTKQEAEVSTIIPDYLIPSLGDLKY
jgi:4-nitrophenyl phosphatase